MKKVLFFDIDQVFNSKNGHDFLFDIFKDKEEKLNHSNTPNDFYVDLLQKCNEFGIRFLKNDKLPSGYDFGNFIEVDLVKDLIKLIENQNVITVGISSWFISREKEDLEAISECLGFPVHFIGHNTGSADERLKGAVKWLKENVKENEETFVVYLDDMVHFDLNYDYKTYYQSSLSAFKEMLSTYNTLFVSPKNGLKQNEINNIIKWLS